MKTPLRRPAATLTFVAVATTLGGCSVLRGTPDTPDVTNGPPVSDTIPAPDTALSAPNGDSMKQRLLAGDYPGVLRLYWNDSTLHTNEEALYRAALASAMPAHSAHDERLAAGLFERFLSLYPDSPHGPVARLYLSMFARQAELRSTIGRLDHELQQLKAIDLGRQPEARAP